MTRFISYISLFCSLACMLSACGKSDAKREEVEENRAAKEMLAGIWIDSEEDRVTFKVDGDTIYYPDSTSQPVAFKIVGDTMMLLGNNVSKYLITRQERYNFEFRNQNGDPVKLVKSENPDDSLLFVRTKPVTLNQETLIKRDTVVYNADEKYHCYVQVNPTRYKVYRVFTNADGMEVENVYYDNIVHVSVFNGANKVFSRNFKKDDFKNFVPDNVLRQTILSDMAFMGLDDKGIHYRAQLAIPDSPSSFMVEVLISYDGKMSMSVGS